MARTATEALAVPSVLRWARESSGLSARDAARRLKVREDQLGRWEAAEERPSVSALESLARLYKRPLALFFLPAPPNEDPLPRDFRMLPEGRAALSSQSRLAFRRARRVQAIVAELSSSLDRSVQLRLRRWRLSDNPEAAASSTRSALGISLDAQLEWRGESEALASWRQAVEAQGVLVLQASVPVTEFRGFSLADRDPPVVVLNGRDAMTARTFSLFHELAHVLLASPGICTMEAGPDGEATKGGENAPVVEVYCNKFAAALLVPEPAFRARVESIGSRREWSDDVLRDLARIFKVSREVALLRLVTLGFANAAFYRRKHEQWREPKPRTARGGFGVQPAEQCLRNTGATAVSLVFEAHHRGAITHRDVADYLGLRTKHLPRVERLLRRSSSP